MPTLAEHQSSKFVKLMYIGDSGTGKTGSCVSLLKAGYDLVILDMDNGLDALVQFAKHECPERLGNVRYETVRDKYKGADAGPVIDGQPKAYVAANKLLTKWSDGSAPSEFGEKTVFIVDSLTAMGKAAFEWAKGLNPGAKDPRQWYFTAQQSLENTIALLTSEAFHSNLVIISHINYKELQDGTTKGYPSAIGSALGSIIPKYFNSLILAERSGSGQNVKRKIKTVPTELVDLKNPAPFSIDRELDLGSGLATIFEKIKST